MKILLLLLTLELGVIPNGHLKVYDFNRSVEDGVSFYGDLNFEAQMFNNLMFLGMDAKVYMWKTTEGYTFKPDNIEFLVTVGFRFRNIIEIGFRHYCQHPVKAWNNGNEPTVIEHWYEEIYIKFFFVLGG